MTVVCCEISYAIAIVISVITIGTSMNTKPILTLAMAIAFNTLTISSVASQEIETELLCKKFPLNSRCEDYPATKAKPHSQYQLDRQDFCEQFPFNSQCQRSPLQVIRFNLDRSGENDEWVRIEQQDNRIKLSHTSRVKDGLVSGIFNSVVGALFPVPLPFVEANKYDWEDHRVIKVKFQSDRQDRFTVIGKDTLILPEGADLYNGLFTITYKEEDLIRSVSFEVPPNSTIETDNTIIVETH